MPAFTKILDMHIKILLNDSSVNILSYFFCSSIYVQFKLSLVSPLSFFGFLLYFHLCWPIPSLSYPFLQTVMWICHWVVRRQHNYTTVVSMRAK